VNVLLALALGERLPDARFLAAALALGAVSYGVSVFLDALALRDLGAAREAAVFAVAPFVGAVVAPFVLPESFGRNDVVAGVLMVVGVVLLVRAGHEHAHVHEPLDHDHAHVHDAHHQHEHDEPVPPGTRHAHPHHHGRLTHTHAHVSDLHHRHAH
jgi:hypothetical protein